MHREGLRWFAVTVAVVLAAPMTLTGLAVAGFSFEDAIGFLRGSSAGEQSAAEDHGDPQPASLRHADPAERQGRSESSRRADAGRPLDRSVKAPTGTKPGSPALSPGPESPAPEPGSGSVPAGPVEQPPVEPQGALDDLGAKVDAILDDPVAGSKGVLDDAAGGLLP